jgi:hypothetical protein
MPVRRPVVAVVLSLVSGLVSAFWSVVAGLTGGIFIVGSAWGKGGGDRMSFAMSGIALLLVAVGLLAVPVIGGLALVRRGRPGWAIALALAWIPAAPLVLMAYLTLTSR